MMKWWLMKSRLIWSHAIRNLPAFRILLFIKEFIQELNRSNAHTKDVIRSLRHPEICKTIWTDIPTPNHTRVINVTRNSTGWICWKLTVKRLTITMIATKNWSSEALVLIRLLSNQLNRVSNFSTLIKFYTITKVILIWFLII